MLAAAWLLCCVTLLGILVFPLTAYLFPQLPARGWPLSRIIGLLVLTYGSWLFATLIPSRLVFGGTLLLIALLGWLGWAMRGKQLLAGLSDRRFVLQSEIVFLGCFLLFCVLRGFTGDLTTSEKYMDMGFINSIVLKPQVPPRDMWFAGQTVNYYYLGHWLLAALSSAARIDSLTLFGLALPLIAALYIQLSWFIVQACLGSGRRLLAGTLVLWFILLSSTPGATERIVAAALDPRAAVVSEANFSGPANEIVDPTPIAGVVIDEFPAFSLLWGDIHAHMINMPIVLCSIALLLQRLRRAMEDRQPESVGYRCVWYGTFAILLGCHYAINSFDMPLVAGLFVLTEVALVFYTRGSVFTRWGGAAVRTAATLAGSILAVWPFHAAFKPFVLPAEQTPYLTALPGPLGRVFAFTPIATQLGEFLALTGFVLAIMAAVYVVQLVSQRSPAVIWLLWLSGLPFVLWRPIMVVLVPLLLLSIYFTLRGPFAMRIACGLMVAALALWIAPEIVMIRDLTERRMNTVFKWYFQTNLLLGVALPILVALTARSEAGPRRWLVYGAVVGAVVIGSVYVPVAVTYVVRDNGSRWWGLDGLAQVQAYHPDEAAAIRWLRQQPDTGGVLEIVGKRADGTRERLRPSRVSAYTGRPTMQGWSKHVWLWHNLTTDPEGQLRFGNAGAIESRVYQQGDVNSIQAACTYGDIRYIYYGMYEKKLTSRTLDLAALPAGLTTVFETPGVTIYRCPAVTAAIAPVPSLYAEERSEDGRWYWLKSANAKLRVYSETAGVVRLRTGIAGVRDDLLVEVRRDGQTLTSLRVGTADRTLEVLLPVVQGVTEWDLVVDGQPLKLSAQDTREGTVSIGALEADHLSAASQEPGAGVGLARGDD